MNKKLQSIHKNISLHPGWKWLILSTVLLGATMSALDVSIVNVALPTLKNRFGVSIAVVEWIAMAYMLTLTIFLPLFGRLADVYGRSRLYNIGLLVFSMGSLLCGISASAGFMITSRVIQAVGAGLLQANSIALITQAFPEGERGKAIGVQGAVQAISMAVGPFVGGILIATVGWRAIFYVNIPIGILAAIAALFILPRDQKIKEKQTIDYLGTAFFASGLASIVLAINEGVKLGWGSHTIMLYFVSGVVLLTLFVITELKVESPLMDLRLFKNATFFLGNLTSMLSYYVLFGLMFLMPFYLEKVMGYGVALTGSLLTPLLLTMAVVAPFSGYISDKYGPRIMTTSGMLISALACFALMLMGTSAQLSLLVAVLALLGIGMGLFTPSNNSAVMGSAPQNKLGVAGGVLNMTRSLGFIFGINISGVIFTTLEHGYLAEKGYPNAQHVFSNSTIPMTVKANAFMHGFLVVIGVLLAINLLSAFLSASRRVKAAAIIDHEAAGTVVISSGFFNGFGQEARGTALFISLLLFTGIAGAFASSGIRSESSLVHQTVQSEQEEAGRGQSVSDAEKLAMAYYGNKYKDTNVRIEVTPRGDHMDASVTKNGMLVKRLSIQGNTITEHGSGVRTWAFELLDNVN
jgi:EmrB/QacA subfamily drug resistance transporter